MKKLSALNLKYYNIQMLYFGIYVALKGYASVYLLGKGFSNSKIGLVLALASTLAVLIQPVVASFLDKNKQIELRKVVIIFLIIMAAMSFSILFAKEGTILLLCFFVGIATLHEILMPLLNAMAFIFEKHGIEINYGMGRGLGSAAYAIISLILGYLVKDFGMNIFPIVYLTFNIVLIFVVYLFVIPTNNKRDLVNKETNEQSKQLSFFDFCKRYKKYILFIIGLVFVYFTHILINDFFIQIILPIGGTESQMGIAVFISAIAELPTMFFFNKFRKKIDCSYLICVAVIFFAIKHLVILYSNSIIMIYISETFEMLSYALLVPASVYYANMVIEKSDTVKGQSLITMAHTTSGIVASLIGGIMLDKTTVHNVLMGGVVISIIGAIIVVLSVKNSTLRKR